MEAADKRKTFPVLELCIIPLVSAVMRVAWLTPFVRFALDNEFVIPRHARFPAWLILLLLIVPSLVVRLLAAHSKGAHLSTLAGLAAVAGTVGYAFRADVAHVGEWARVFAASQGDWREGLPAVLIVVVAAAGIWWRGMTAVWHDYTELFGGFITGVVALGALMLAAGQGAWARRGLDVWACLSAFVLSGLLALALMAVYEMLTWERFRGRGGPGLSRYWLTAVATLVVSVLFSGWAVGQVMSLGMGQVLASLWRPVGWLLERGLEFLFLGWGYLVFHLFGGLVEVLRSIVARNWHLIIGLLQRFAGEHAEQVEQVAQPSAAAQVSVRVLFWVCVVCIVGILFHIAFRQYGNKRYEDKREDREFILTKDLFVDQLRSVFRGMRRRRPMAPLLALEEIEDARRMVRDMYRRMLIRMGSLGYARLPSHTPRAYERSLAPVVKGERQALRTLTEAYLLARYAPEPPTRQQVHEAARALARLEAQLGNSRGGD